MPRIVVRDLLARRSDLRPLKFEVGMGQDWIVCVPCMPCIFNYCMSWYVHICLHRRPNFVGPSISNVTGVW
jgi:hypothetical protein